MAIKITPFTNAITEFVGGIMKNKSSNNGLDFFIVRFDIENIDEFVGVNQNKYDIPLKCDKSNVEINEALLNGKMLIGVLYCYNTPFFYFTPDIFDGIEDENGVYVPDFYCNTPSAPIGAVRHMMIEYMSYDEDEEEQSGWYISRHNEFFTNNEFFISMNKKNNEEV